MQGTWLLFMKLDQTCRIFQTSHYRMCHDLLQYQRSYYRMNDTSASCGEGCLLSLSSSALRTAGVGAVAYIIFFRSSCSELESRRRGRTMLRCGRAGVVRFFFGGVRPEEK